MPDLEALLQETLPRVRRQAQLLATPTDPSWDVDDLCQEGAIGLLAIAERYDATRGATFWTYAEFRILGAMRDARRELDPVPRSLRTKARAIAQAVQALTQQLGRAPDAPAVAQALEMSLETYEQWRLAVASFERTWSLDYRYDTGEDEVEHSAFLAAPTPGPATHMERVDEQRQRAEALARAIDLLPANEAQVVRLRYWDELSLKAIGAQLEVSESRASQLHTAAITRLQRLLTMDDDDDWTRVAAQITQRQAQKKATALALHGLGRLHGNAAYLRAWRAQRKEQTT